MSQKLPFQDKFTKNGVPVLGVKSLGVVDTFMLTVSIKNKTKVFGDTFSKHITAIIKILGLEELERVGVSAYPTPVLINFN